ncbi:cation diffusion facilitator family transporter [Agrococcus baldri]|uniref:Cation diffusion facilitator family transporter n=1 Tax=Agrococcus baldri TaxID=153730 RepID=A0AA94KYW1_9MICO|nr:cation diffusion facilitator family transporter [Agrococcus baldri]SFS01997.1 cation diffusion facilitator family transporter [Agrococcus baldri]
MSRTGRLELPEQQERLLRKARNLEWAVLAYTAVTITVVALVMGNSQAMQTAWVEDILSTLPQIAFLVALPIIRRKPTAKHPYGYHRAMGVGHLVAGVALLAVGANLCFEAISGLVKQEHPPIGTMQLFGMTIWQGWVMIAVMALIVIGPLIYGPMKMKLAKQLDNKLLYADAAMAKADWTTNAGSIVGVLGIGLGIWWLDGAAALFISASILWDGITNTRGSVLDLMDMRATTYDQKQPHPVHGRVDEVLRGLRWVHHAASRIRDEGQVFHVEAYVVPKRAKVKVSDLDRAVDDILALDWRVQDVSVSVVSQLDVPDEEEEREEQRGRGSP